MAIFTIIRSLRFLNQNASVNDVLMGCDYDSFDSAAPLGGVSGNVEVLILSGDNAQQCEVKIREAVRTNMLQRGATMDDNNVFQHALRRG